MIALLPVNLRLALRSLNRNRLRTLLTMLGIIIGVAAVLTMVGLGGGARAAVQNNVKSAGTNLVFVKAGNYTRGGESVGIATGLGAATTLVPADAQAIRDNVIGTYLHGPVLAKSARFADNLLLRALRRRGLDDTLEPLDDALADRAAKVAVGRPR